jgi:hypothetical protein
MKRQWPGLTATLLYDGTTLVAGGECYQVLGHVGPTPWKTAERGHIEPQAVPSRI